MRRFYISEMDARAPELALEWGMGLELIAFCIPENMENPDMIAERKRGLLSFPYASLHAPYYELSPCAIDPLIREVARRRFAQALETCSKLGIRRMIVHSGYAPQVYFPQWFVPESVAFWKDFICSLPVSFELMIENVLDVSPEHIAAVCDGIADERVGICLDTGHVNAYSQIPVNEWISYLGQRIRHVHLHNNYGDYDAHAPLDEGSLNIPDMLNQLDRCAPEAAICIESREAGTCLRYLKEKGYIHEESL